MVRTIYAVNMDIEHVIKLREEYPRKASDLINNLLNDYFAKLNNKVEAIEDKETELLNKKKEAEQEYEELIKQKEEEINKLQNEEKEAELKKQNKLREVSDSVYDFFKVDKMEANGWAKTYIEAKEENPKIDFWEFFYSKGLEDRKDEDIINDVFGSD